jgi:type VI secretion system protein VasJ
MSETALPESDLLPQAQELAAPISAALPVGEDPKYSTEFEFVKAEIAKMSERDWEQIAAASRKVLLTQAKDITLLCYHMLAGTMSRGWGEGAAAAQALSALMAEHWDAIHPQRDRARQNAFKWLVEERTTGTFAQVAHSMEDHASLTAFAQALGRIRDLIERKFPDNPPSLKPLQQLVEEKAKATKPVAAASPSAANPASTSGSQAAPSSGPAPTVADGASKGDLMMVLQKIALQMSASDPASPVGWKLLRVCRWQELTALPKNDGGKTAFAAPNPARVSFLEGQFAQKSWGTILEKSETIFTEPGLHLWLDLQYWVVEALVGRGQEPCADAVRGELRGLLKRVPGLVDLKFADGSPVASVQTRDWLDQIAREGGGGPARSAAAREDTLEADLQAARELASSGRVADALDLLQAGLLYGDLRSRTVRQLEIARTALLGGKIRPALSVSTEIADRAERLDLGAWEPLLGREIMEVHLKALNAALEAGIGAADVLLARREALATRAGSTDPALLARFEF